MLAGRVSATFFSSPKEVLSVVEKNAFLLLVMLLISGGDLFCQKQLVLLKKDRVVLRLNPGDEFVYKPKNSRAVIKSYVNNLSDTSVVIHKDTIAFYKIERIYFQRSTLGNKLGAGLVVAGGMLFLIDQLNFTVLQGNDPSIDRGVALTSLAGAAIGLPFLLLKRKYWKVNRKHRLRMVQKGSIFYLNTHEPGNPYFDN